MVTPDQKRQAKLEEKMGNEYTLKFTMRELIFIYNVLCAQSYKVGDGKICYGIVVEKLQPIVAVDSNVPEENAQDAVILTDEKKEIN